MYKNSQGFTLIEVLIALMIIMGISTVAYKHHLSIVYRNSELTSIQKDLFLSESQFDIDYGHAELWVE